MDLLLAGKVVLGYLRLHCVCEEGVRRVAGIGGALGWASLRKGQALRRVREPRPIWEVIPAQGPDSSEGGKIRAPCMI